MKLSHWFIYILSQRLVARSVLSVILTLRSVAQSGCSKSEFSQRNSNYFEYIISWETNGKQPAGFHVCPKNGFFFLVSVIFG